MQKNLDNSNLAYSNFFNMNYEEFLLKNNYCRLIYHKLTQPWVISNCLLFFLKVKICEVLLYNASFLFSWFTAEMTQIPATRINPNKIEDFSISVSFLFSFVLFPFCIFSTIIFHPLWPFVPVGTEWIEQ